MKRIPLRLTVGVVLVVAGQSMILAHHAPISDFYFPVVWSGYVFTVDGLLDWFTGTSLWRTAPAAMLWMVPASSGFWWVFEACNLAVGSWRYTGAGAFQGISYYALASISFATVIPAVWVTATCINAFVVARFAPQPNGVGEFTAALQRDLEQHEIGGGAIGKSDGRGIVGRSPDPAAGQWMLLAFAGGIACLVLPLLFPRYAFGLIWGAVFLLVDPINYKLGRPSIIRQVLAGKFSTTVSFALGGLVCGFFWEFWNYWSVIKWVYNVPFVSQFHLFEMPLPGYLGYLPFGLEVYAATMFVVPSLLAVRFPRRRSDATRGVAGDSFDRQTVQPCEVESVTAP